MAMHFTVGPGVSARLGRFPAAPGPPEPNRDRVDATQIPMALQKHESCEAVVLA